MGRRLPLADCDLRLDAAEALEQKNPVGGDLAAGAVVLSAG